MKKLLFPMMMLAACAAGQEASEAVRRLREAALAGNMDASRAAVELAAGTPGTATLLVEEMRHGNSKVRAAAGAALAEIQPLPRGAARRLVAAMDDKDQELSRYAAEVLTRAEGAYEPVAKALRDRNPRVRMRALYVLGKRRELRLKDYPRVLELLKDADQKVRENAVWALGEFNSRPERTLPALFAFFSEASQESCGRAASAIARLGQEQLREGALKRLSSPSDAGRACAAYSLIFAGELPAAAAASLRAALEDKDPAVRGSAAMALSKTAPATPGIAPELARELASQDPRRRVDAAWGLSIIGPAAAGAAAPLEAALADKHPAVRVNAAAALARLGIKREESLKELCEALKSTDTSLRITASWAYTREGKAAAACLPAVEAALTDADKRVREHAVYVLWNLGPSGRRAIPAFVRARPDLSELDEKYLNDILARLGPADPAAVPELAASVLSGRYNEPVFALWALARMGPAAAGAVPALLEASRSDDYILHASRKVIAGMGRAAAAPLAAALGEGSYPRSVLAAELLPELGPAGLKPLKEALASGDEFIVMCAARGAGQAGKPAAALLPDLRRLERHPSRFVRARAAESASSISYDLAGKVYHYPSE